VRFLSANDLVVLSSRNLSLTHRGLALPVLSRTDQVSGVLVDLGDIATAIGLNPSFDSFRGALFAEVTCSGNVEAFEGIFHVSRAGGVARRDGRDESVIIEAVELGKII
jgi:hypothetical protein